MGYKTLQNGQLSNLMDANIEALANGESGSRIICRCDLILPQNCAETMAVLYVPKVNPEGT